MAVANKVRKGDIVALRITHSITAATTLRRTTYDKFTLCKVASATRDGRAKELIRRSGSTLSLSRREYALGDVYVLPHETPRDVWERAYEALSWPGDEFDSAGDLAAHCRQYAERA